MALYPEYPIATARLRLRPFTWADVDAVFAYRGREEVARYLFDPPLSRDECVLAVRQRATQASLVAEGDRIILAVDRADSGELAGEVSLIWRSAEARQGEVGWIFHPDQQGQGFAEEAAAALLHLAFRLGEFHRIYARCNVHNMNSWRLMERLGMRREAHFVEHAILRESWDEEYFYAILQSEWCHGHPSA